MSVMYHVDPERDVPIYQQLVDEISADIRSGRLACGEKLPTVQEMETQLGIARGTIKRAYDDLEHQGLIEKVQGRGTFVCFRTVDSASRKEQAMAAIDQLFDRMAQLDFSLSEVGIFLDLKLRERENRTPNLKVAAVECNPESLSQMVEQLRQIRSLDIYSYLLDDVVAYPYKIGEEMDLIVTTTEHFAALEKLVPHRDQLVCVALRLATNYMTRLVKLRPGQTVGILSGSDRFAQLMRSTCETYAERLNLTTPVLFSHDLNMASYTEGKDAVLVPEDCERFCPRELHSSLRSLEKKGKLIRCAYRVDEGSLIYLQEKIGRLREKRSI